MLLSLKLPRLHLGQSRLDDPLRFLHLALQRLAEIRAAIGGRRALAAMDGRMLSDIGLSRAEAEEEINRKPWDITVRPR